MKEEISYTWSQTPDEVEIVIQLSDEKLTSKQIKANGLDIKYKDKQVMTVKYEGKELLKLCLFSNIDPDGCSWTLRHNDKGTSLVVICEKADLLSWHGWSRLIE